MSIQPYWGFLIIAKKRGWDLEKYGLHEKTVEMRKRIPTSPDWDKKMALYFSKNKKSLSRIPEEYRGEVAKLCGKVVCEFVCDKIDHYKPFYRYNFNEIGLPSSSEQTYFVFEDDLKKTCLTFSEFKQYGHGAPLHGLHISDLKIYDKPKGVSEFWRPCPFKTEDQDNDCIQCDAAADSDTGIVCTNRVWKAPQSWCYVEERGV